LVDPHTLEPTGERVMALLPGGGYAQYAKTLRSHTMELDDDMSYERAACIPKAFCTAYQLLNWEAKVQAGETALVHAAASGVGAVLLQMCELQGVNTIAVASSDSKLEFCEQLGAEHMINRSRTPEFSKAVLQHTDNKGVDLILDPVLGSSFNENLNSLSLDARWLLYGHLGGTNIQNANLAKLLMKRATLVGSGLRGRSSEYKAKLFKEMYTQYRPLLYSGKVSTSRSMEFKLSEVHKAHHCVEKNNSIGKVVLVNDLH